MHKKKVIPCLMIDAVITSMTQFVFLFVCLVPIVTLILSMTTVEKTSVLPFLKSCFSFVFSTVSGLLKNDEKYKETISGLIEKQTSPFSMDFIIFIFFLFLVSKIFFAYYKKKTNAFLVREVLSEYKRRLRECRSDLSFFYELRENLDKMALKIVDSYTNSTYEIFCSLCFSLIAAGFMFFYNANKIFALIPVLFFVAQTILAYWSVTSITQKIDEKIKKSIKEGTVTYDKKEIEVSSYGLPNFLIVVVFILFVMYAETQLLPILTFLSFITYKTFKFSNFTKSYGYMRTIELLMRPQKKVEERIKKMIIKHLDLTVSLNGYEFHLLILDELLIRRGEKFLLLAEQSKGKTKFFKVISNAERTCEKDSVFAETEEGKLLDLSENNPVSSNCPSLNSIGYFDLNFLNKNDKTVSEIVKEYNLNSEKVSKFLNISSQVKFLTETERKILILFISVYANNDFSLIDGVLFQVPREVQFFITEEILKSKKGFCLSLRSIPPHLESVFKNFRTWYLIDKTLKENPS